MEEMKIKLCFFTIAITGLFLFNIPVIAQTEDLDLAIGPQVNISLATGKQIDPAVAYDSVNNRFLIVWTDQRNDTGQPYWVETDVYGQLINADGSPYGDVIPVSVLSGKSQASPKVAFDPVNKIFLVVWGDDRDRINNWDYGPTNTYGQLINTDGSLYKSNFKISYLTDSCYHMLVPFGLVFDPSHQEFMIGMGGTIECSYVHNIYGRFIKTVDLLSGSLSPTTNPIFPITSFTEGYGVWRAILSHNSNDGRFLVAYGRDDDKHIHGKLLNNDGTFYNEEFTISTTLGPYDRGNAINSVAFDPSNNRFLALWDTAYNDFNIRGQLINADGTLYGSEIIISADYPSDGGWSVFDAANNKFLVVGYGGSSLTIFGQLLNPDGSLDGTPFLISDDIPNNIPDIVFGSQQTGSLIVWPSKYDNNYDDIDILGSFVKLKSTTVKPIPASINCNPKVLNLKSKGQWITCYLELPEEYDLNKVDVSSIILNSLISAQLNPTGISDFDNDGSLEKMIKFDMQTVQKILEPGNAVNLIVSGQVSDNLGLVNFKGTDMIKVTDK